MIFKIFKMHNFTYLIFSTKRIYSVISELLNRILIINTLQGYNRKLNCCNIR